MIGLGLAVLLLAVGIWVLFGLLHTCGHEEHHTMRTCTRVHWRSCYEHVELADTAPDGQMYREFWRMVWSEHVYTNEDWLYQYDPC